MDSLRTSDFQQETKRLELFKALYMLWNIKRWEYRTMKRMRFTYEGLLC